jgi:exodeoxyribonuclease V beta subunit
MRTPGAFHLTKTPLERGASLIEASAGTGKTYAITALVVRLILEENLSVREILVVTYTEAATEELRGRVRQTLAQASRAFATMSSDVPFLRELVEKFRSQAAEMQARLENALCAFDQAPIYTIHGFCQRTLRDRAFESGQLFDTELVADPSEILQEVADDFWRIQFYEARPALINFALANRIGPEAFMRLLQTCVSYPKLEFISPAKGAGIERLAAELEAGFENARAVWLAEREQIKSCFGSATGWGNKPYNADDEMAALFEQLEACFSANETAYEALGCLQEFCASALEEKQSKRSKLPIPAHHFFTLCEDLCRSEKSWLAGVQLAFVDYARRELPRRKAERKIQSFDDLLTRLDQALEGPSGQAMSESLRQKYKAALIDEFQDTDPIQYQIFRRAFPGQSAFVFMIGDPKQAIYGFRGADIFTYLEAAGQAVNRYTLGENWRSESGLVQAVNTIFSLSPRAFVFDRIEFQPAIPKGKADDEPLTLEGQAEPPFQLWFQERQNGKDITKKLAEKTLPGAVASEIVRLLNGPVTVGQRKLKPEDIAVLVLENRQAAMIQEALEACRVPSVLHTTASLFASQEAAEFQRVLEAIAAPGREPLVRSALATDFLGISGCQLEAMTDQQWQKRVERLHHYLHLWKRHGFFRMFRHWAQTEQVRPRVLAFANGERRLTNLLHLSEVLHHAETQGHLGTSGLLKWLAAQMALDKETSEEHQLRLERDENAVRIVTVHKSKGLEYPVVFCPFSWKSSEIKRGTEEQVFFHDPKRNLRLVRDIGPAVAEEHRQLAREERLAENVRLLYVALTRARHRCYFAWGGLRGAGTSAPAWLLHPSPPSDRPLLQALEGHFQTLTDDQMLAQLHGLETSSSGAIQIVKLASPSPCSYKPEQQQDAPLEARVFDGCIRRDWMISSFTRFHAGLQEETPDRDSIDSAPRPETPGTGMFAFPRGAKAGTCLHEILEKVDFQADETALAALARQRLEANNLAQPGHLEAVCQMLKNLLSFPLELRRQDFNLASITTADRLNELEFYFPLKNVTLDSLRAALARFGWARGRTHLNRLELETVNGFLKGYIDLVFRFEDRFYIVDWKSNWLGNAIEDYSQPALEAEMLRHNYFMQYHFYSVALDKYLNLRLRGYEYERHFGGVFYLFLRGLDPARPEFGALRARPEAAAIRVLSRLLEGI